MSEAPKSFWTQVVRLEFIVLPTAFLTCLLALGLAWNVSRTAEANREIAKFATDNARNACAVKYLREHLPAQTVIERVVLAYYDQQPRIDCSAFAPPKDLLPHSAR